MLFRSSVLKIAGRSIVEISELGMHNFFTDIFKEVREFGTTYLTSVYDVKFDEDGFIVND